MLGTSEFKSAEANLRALQLIFILLEQTLQIAKLEQRDESELAISRTRSRAPLQGT